MKYFPPFRLDEQNECLWRDRDRVHLTRKAFDVLRHLIEHAGRLVTKHQLLQAVWPDTFVQEENLKVHIQEIRRTLGDSPKNPIFIETLQRRGYRFVAKVNDEQLSGGGPAARQLFGREEPLESLVSMWDRVMHGERQIVFVGGERGIGKSALIDAFVRRTEREHGAAGGVGQCLSSVGEREAYYPWLDALGQLCRVSERRVQILAKYAPTWLRQFPDLSVAGPTPDGDLDVLHRRMLREIVEAVEALAADQPLLIVLEDLHLADVATLDAIVAVARRQRPARLAIVASYRTDDGPSPAVASLQGGTAMPRHPFRRVRQELQIPGLAHEVILGPLTVPALMACLEDRSGGSTVSEEFARSLHQQTGGNPLLIDAAAAAASAHLSQSESVDQPKGIAPARALVADALGDMVNARIDELTAHAQRALEAASVAGPRFNTWMLAACLDGDLDQVETLCEALATPHQLLRADGLDELPNGTLTTAYVFRQGVVADVAHRRQSPLGRTRLHSRIGEAMEAMYSERLGEVAIPLAHHFEESRDFGRAVRYLQLGAESAARRGDADGAASLLESATRLAKHLPVMPGRAAAERIARLERIIPSPARRTRNRDARFISVASAADSTPRGGPRRPSLVNVS
jgi:predicted ATPase/DNA-binding winged helix-turn-helix (wHTH) protein